MICAVKFVNIIGHTVILFSLQWLEDEFMTYLTDWERSVEEREGFSKTEKGNMLLSHPTRLGLKMTCNLLYSKFKL